jgi:O-antigen/teichoic acid export membrane protein
MLLSVLTPVAAELEARKDREETYRLFLSASRYVAAAAFALFAGLIVTADSLIEAWIGSGYGASVVVMRILCLGLVFNIAAGAVSPLVQGLGRVDFQRNTQILSLSLNVVFSIVLMQRYGFYGAPVGTAIALVISSSYYLWSFHRFMGRPVTAFVQSILVKPAVAAALAAVPSLVLSSVLMARASGNAWAALSVFLLTGGIFALVYGGLLLQWRYIDLGAIAQYRNAG